MTPERRQRVECLCRDALERDPSVRSAFLDDACAGDDDLRSEVESLLAEEGPAESFFEFPVNVSQLLLRWARVPPGRLIGNYEVIGLLGVGGMGEVYRARDVRLHRQVALKVLSPLLSDPTSLARFGREAQILAGLNHPNIAAIYGVEEGGDFHALVLELVEGETLAARLKRGRVPIEEASQIARQIAAALAAAHECGLIHRDIKPSNVALRPDGTVKILDFGIAKALPSPIMAGATPQSETVTQPELILGTPAYLSPEQARGQGVDRGADIWAFGCVFLEMLTGQPVFQRATSSDTVAAVLTEEPDWTRIPTDTPDTITRLLRRCLQKNSRHRLRDIGDAGLDLEDSLAQRAGSLQAQHASAWRRHRETLAWTLAGLAVALLAVRAFYFGPSATRESVVRFEVAVPQTQSFTDRGGPYLQTASDWLSWPRARLVKTFCGYDASTDSRRRRSQGQQAPTHHSGLLTASPSPSLRRES